MRIATLDKMHRYLFSDHREQLSSSDQELVRLYEDVFTIWLDKPSKPDKEIREYIIKQYSVNERTAYRYISEIKYLLGNVTNARKEWQRYKVISMIDEAYQLAKDNEDPLAMIAAADKLGKYTQLDKEDAKEMPWDEIVPQPFSPTDDPTIIGLKKIPNLQERINQLKKRYLEEIDIEDATEIKDITDGEEG